MLINEEIADLISVQINLIKVEIFGNAMDLLPFLTTVFVDTDVSIHTKQCIEKVENHLFLTKLVIRYRKPYNCNIKNY